jgi:hypothetical protein
MPGNALVQEPVDPLGQAGRSGHHLCSHRRPAREAVLARDRKLSGRELRWIAAGNMPGQPTKRGSITGLDRVPQVLGLPAQLSEIRAVGKRRDGHVISSPALPARDWRRDEDDITKRLI